VSLFENAPPEHPGGQDDQPPNLRRALIVTRLLLSDVDAYLREFEGDPADLRLRIDAARKVLRRLVVEEERDGSDQPG